MSFLHPTGQFNNSAKDYKQIQAKPLASSMGAEIQGVNIQDVNEESFAEIQDALFRHKMIFFKNQNITHDEQEAFTRLFGEIGTDAYTTGSKDNKNVQPVIKEADTQTKMIFGSGWHTDSPFLKQPPAISLLYGVDIPPYGGDTMWCNCVLAYNNLSDTMKQVIAPLRVLMNATNVIEAMEKDSESTGEIKKHGNMDMKVDKSSMLQGSYHPMVRTHPISKEKSLFVDRTYSQGIEGMSADEAKAILDFLATFATQPSFTCRLRWEPNTFVMWDNRICLHQAFNDYDGFRREMYRSTVLGEIPS